MMFANMLLNHFKRASIIILAGYLASCSIPKTDLEPDQMTLLTIEKGEIIGSSNNKTYQWLGIQYGSIPDSSFRWKKASETEAWEGIHEALEFGNTCIQRGSLINTTKRRNWGELVGSEDCLYLNVWTPLNALEPSSGKIPVMVWIHGGSNVSGNADFYDPSELVRTQDVIVVSINYRLGPFGWFRHPDINSNSLNAEDQSGNYGNLDTIQALEWVQKNIGYFGGDSSNVTIFGESAGGYNVAALLSAKNVKGLFHKAIIQSGGIKPGDIEHSESYLENNLPWKNYSSRELVNQLILDKGMAPDRDSATSLQEDMSDNEIEELMRNASAVEVYEAYLTTKINTNEMLRPFPDGFVLSELGIIGSLESGFNDDIPIMIGTNRDEMKLFLLDNPRLTKEFLWIPRIRDLDLWNAVSKHRTNAWKYLAVDGPAQSLTNQGRSNIFAYQFDWDDEPKKFGVDLKNLLGASHAFEIPFVMGNFDEDALTKYILSKKNLKEVKTLSNAMMSYWAEFAYNGDPNKGRKGDLTEWESWDPSEDSNKFIVFDSKFDGGIRMTEDSLTEENLIEMLAMDDRIKDKKWKCEILDAAIMFDNFADQDLLKEFNNQQCIGFDPASEWRKYWYDEKKKRF
jgi:para-nitrobenzyl esterase